jgi:hypothetical protein
VASQARSTVFCFSTEACFTPSSLSNAGTLVGSVVTVMALPFCLTVNFKPGVPAAYRFAQMPCHTEQDVRMM